ncbi:MAG: hypothetical protein AAF666_18405 [Pseudomonadota bacterium]
MFKWIGIIFLTAATALVAAELILWESGPFALASLGELWFWAHKDSLLLLQPAVERHISPDLFDPYIQSLLEWPLAIELLVLGAVFLLPWLLFRRRAA